MIKLFAEIRADIRQRWLRFVQAVNGLAVGLAGGALVVQQSYPDTFKSLVANVPGKYQLLVLFAFGAVVHYALSQAAKAPKP